MVRTAPSVTVIISAYATWECKEDLNGMVAFLTANSSLLFLKVNRNLVNRITIVLKC